MHKTLLISILSSFFLYGCNVGKDDNTFAYGTNNGSSQDTGSSSDTGTTSDTSDTGETTPDTGDTAVVEPSGEDTGEGSLGEENFDEVGDVVIGTDEDGDSIVEVDLSDSSGENNQEQEFYLIVVNPSDEALGYTLKYSTPSSEDEEGEEGGEGGEEGGEEGPEESRSDPDLPQSLVQRNTVVPPSLPPPPFTSSDIGFARKEYKVRDSLDDEESYEKIEAILWAVGTNVNIWVDESVYIDWDFECDGVIDQPAFNDSYGFDNCDLETIASIVDINIFPNIRSIFGDESDVNADGKVSVVITPVLNQMTRGLDEEELEIDLDISLVGSYADPSIDLSDYEPSENPMSDEEEVIFLHAPDPYGFHNPEALTPISEYTNVTLGTQIARSFFQLVSYNQHVLVSEGEEEETWVTEGLSALASDLTGFGAPNLEGVWGYMDASHLSSLTSIEESGAIATSTFGAQYLFFRWIADAYGEEILASVVQSGSTGTTGIETALEEDMTTLALQWQLALMSTHSTAAETGLDIDLDDFPPYAEVSFVQAPITNPTSGQLYGANGYQVGVDVGDLNYYYEGGTTSTPSENTGKRVVLNHTDHSTFAFGQEFFGYIEGGYGAQVVRLVDVPFTQSEIEIRGSKEGFVAAIVRANDTGTKDYTKDISYSATEVNNLVLPALPSNGNTIYGLGDISEPGLTVAVDADGDEEGVDVYDTDRWLLSLSNYPTGAPVQIAAWLDMRYADQNGEVELADPWIAVVPKAYIPVPTVQGTQQGSCSDGYEFGYPYKLLEHLYAQVFLSNTPYNETDLIDPATTEEDETSEAFDPCGADSGVTTTCDEDWDRDGVYDSDEPQPETLLSQIRVMQCTLAGNDVSGFVALTTDIIDADEQDEDEDFSYDRIKNTGGQSVDDYEGAYIETTLEGGKEYLIIVGASQGTGAYELNIKKLAQ